MSQVQVQVPVLRFQVPVPVQVLKMVLKYTDQVPVQVPSTTTLVTSDDASCKLQVQVRRPTRPVAWPEIFDRRCVNL